MIAAMAEPQFDGLHFCDIDKRNCDALRARLANSSCEGRATVLCGDANECVGAVVRTIPSRTLSIAFLDPYGLHLAYETLRVLVDRRADLIVFFPDRLDILRNWETYYFNNPDSNLDRTFGPGVDWRGIRDRTPQSGWAGAFRDLYKQQISALGYDHFEYERIPSTGSPLYLLMYCSRSKTGLDIWRRVCRKKPDGQNTFDW